MVVRTPTAATLEDLYKVEGKAELIDGRIVLMPSGYLPVVIAGEIFALLREYIRKLGIGVPLQDGIGFAQRPPLPSGRESFAPDVAYYTGALPANLMRFIDGAPDFAVEVRSENDYGPGAEVDLTAKRADYFLAGTRVVWDVDPQAATIRCYRADAPDRHTLFTRADTADAEPAVPGWRVSVSVIFA